MTAVILFVAAAMASADIASRMVTWARRRALVDVPNERSSHTIPTPTGAGLAIVCVTIAGALAVHALGIARADQGILALLACGVIIAIVSWIDDHRSVSAVMRLGVHALAAGALVGVVGPLAQVPVPGLGVVDLGILAPVLTIWWLVGFANAFNFMDGIDGIAGTQALVAGLVWGIAGSAAGQPAIAALGWLVAGASIGFLRHNWSPACIFMGDVGAVFLGFVFASLSLIGAKIDFPLAVVGFSAVWPFIFDASFTFARRAWRRENLLKAHRSHLYQRLVIAGWTHGAVAVLYGAAAGAASVAGLAVYYRVPQALTLLAVTMIGLALGIWTLTVTEERRKSREDELALPASGFHHFARNRYILFADIVLVVFAAFAAFAIRFDGLFVLHRPEFPLFLGVVLVAKPLVFFACGLYKRYWRYAGIWDLVAVVLAVSAAEIVVATTVVGTIILQAQLLGEYTSFPRSVLLIDWLVTLTCAGGVRMSVRVFGESAAGRGTAKATDAASEPKRVVIVGAGEAGILVLREIRRNPALQMQVVGFLDDDPSKLGKQIQAMPVLGPFSALVAVAAAHKIDEAVIALPSTPGAIVRRVIESCAEAGISSRSVPGMFELLDGNVSPSRLRNVEIGDLLRRAQISSTPESAAYLAGRCVVVTGAGGSIGAELCSQILRARPERLVLLGHGENSLFSVRHDLRQRGSSVAIDTVVADVRDSRRMRHVFERIQPAVVFHAAAHKHVPLMEENPEEAVTNNIFGTRTVVDAALAANVERLVLISTDKAVEPSSVMGATKRIAERVVMEAARAHGRAFSVVRFGNVLGSRGSVVPVFKRQIELRRPIEITHPDMKRFFMTIPEAVHLVLAAGGLGQGGELFVLDMGDPVSIVDLAQDVIRLSGLRVEDIPIVFTGLRPGEKLEERLWETGAVLERTAHPDVLRVVEPSEERGDVEETLVFLRSAVETGDPTTILFALSTTVPTIEAVIRNR